MRQHLTKIPKPIIYFSLKSDFNNKKYIPNTRVYGTMNFINDSRGVKPPMSVINKANRIAMPILIEGLRLNFCIRHKNNI
jgi:hypothetical protein